MERIMNRIMNDHEQFCARCLDDTLPALKDYILNLLASSCVVDTFIKLITQILAVTQALMVVEFGVMTSVLGGTYEAIMLIQYVPII